MTTLITNPPVVFVYSDFVGQTTGSPVSFPEFVNCTAIQCQNWFNIAAVICSNETCNPAFADGVLQQLLYTLTAHLGRLYAPRDAQGNPAATGAPASPIVGRINSGNEGSVSFGADMGDANAGSPSQAWYMQTQYGATYWAMTAKYRTFRYGRGPRRNFQPIYPFRGRFGW